MKKISKNEGFTVLEVLIAMLILTLSLLLLLNMAMVAMDGNDWSNRATASTQLLQEKLEELRTDMVLSGGIDTVGHIERNWNITKVANHLRRVDITARWANRRGDTLQNAISAYLRTDSI